MELIKAHFYADGIINCPYIEDRNIVENNPSKEELNVIQRITDVYQEKIREAAFRKYDANSVEKLGGLLFSTLATKASGLIAQRQIHM